MIFIGTSDVKPARSVKTTIVHVHGLAEIESAIAATASKPNGGLIVPLDITLNSFMEQKIKAVADHKLPAIYSERVFVANGGLAYYGTDRVEIYRRSASYVDRILRGEKPGDLPYQQPTKYALVINLKTATALGLTIPPRVLFAADEIIE